MPEATRKDRPDVSRSWRTRRSRGLRHSGNKAKRTQARSCSTKATRPMASSSCWMAASKL